MTILDKKKDIFEKCSDNICVLVYKYLYVYVSFSPFYMKNSWNSTFPLRMFRDNWRNEKISR